MRHRNVGWPSAPERPRSSSTTRATLVDTRTTQHGRELIEDPAATAISTLAMSRPMSSGERKDDMLDIPLVHGSYVTSSVSSVSDADDELPSGLSRFQVADGLRHFAQRERLVDDRRDLPGFDELLYDHQAVSRILDATEGVQLAHEGSHHHQLGEAAQAAEPAVARGSVLVVPDQDVGPLGSDRALDGRPRMVPGDVEDDVVSLAAPGEVLLRVVEDPIGADRPDHVQLLGGIHAGHVRSVRLGELHREGPHRPTRAVDQDRLSSRDPSLIANALNRERTGRGDGRGLFERETGGLQLEPGLRNGRVFGEGAAMAPQVGDEALAEDLIAWPEPRDLSGLARKFAYVFRAGAGLVHAAGERTCRSSSRRIRSPRSVKSLGVRTLRWTMEL